MSAYDTSFAELVYRVLDGVASQSEMGTLRKQLEADEGLREQYLDCIEIEGRLVLSRVPVPSQSAHGPALLSESKSHSAALMHPAGEQGAESSASAWLPLAWWLRDKIHNTITVSMILSGLLITTILLLLALWIIPEGKHSTEAVPSRADYVARIHDVQDAEWNLVDDAAAPQRNDDLLVGQRLDLASGFARVRYDNGTMVLLEGPVQFVLTGENAGRLERGKLVTRISAEAPGYVLQAHRTTIVDLGTEFGAFVGVQDDVDVSVFEGKVRVEAPSGKVVLNSGESAVVTPGGRIEHRQGKVQFARRLPREEPGINPQAALETRPIGTGATSQPGIIATKSTGPNGTFSVFDDDAADASQGGTTTFTGTAKFDSDPGKVIDGGVYKSSGTSITTETLSPSVGSELILNLDPSASAGWDILSIVVLTGTNGTTQAGRSDHSYTIALSTDGSTFGSPIINVNDTSTAAEVQVTIVDNRGTLLGAGIKAVKFVFGNATSYNENMVREIDVVAKAATVEPNVQP